MVEVVWSLGYDFSNPYAKAYIDSLNPKVNGQLKTLYLRHKHVPLVHYLSRIEDIYKIMSPYVKIHEKNDTNLDASFFNHNILSNDVICFIKNEATGQIFYYDFIRDFYHFLSYHEQYRTERIDRIERIGTKAFIDNRLKTELKFEVDKNIKLCINSSKTNLSITYIVK